MSEWQPIETAPEGKHLLGWVEPGFVVAMERAPYGAFRLSWTHQEITVPMTHWMLLPEPPK